MSYLHYFLAFFVENFKSEKMFLKFLKEPFDVNKIFKTGVIELVKVVLVLNF